MKKTLLLIIAVFAILLLWQFFGKNVLVSYDKKSNYKITIPSTMNVARIQVGVEESISVGNENLPQIKDDEILVLVKTASFSQMDFNAINRKKSEGNKNGDNFVPCSDFSGIVVATGKNTNIYKVGDKVFGVSDVSNYNGACSEYVAVPESNVYSLPYSLSFQQAASVPTPALLTWLATQKVKAQEATSSILVDDAVSETGTILVSMLVNNGYSVTAIDNDSVAERAKSLGVKKFISNTEYLKKMDEYKKKFDIVIDLEHGLSANRLVDSVKSDGLMISFEKVKVGRKDIRLLIVDLKTIDREVFAKIGRLIHLGKLQVKIAKEYDLKDIKGAYLDAKRGDLDGKVVVNVNK